MENELVRCARCGRRLKHPKFVGGVPYGSVCVKKILKGIVLANPGMSLKDAEGFLGQTNESKGDTMVFVTELGNIHPSNLVQKNGDIINT